MEEDIKVLEEFIEEIEEILERIDDDTNLDTYAFPIDYKQTKALKNLIKGYKELDIENKTLKAHKNGCPALSTTGVECEFKKDLKKLQEGDTNATKM